MGRAIRTLNGARLMGESVGIDTVRLSRTVFVIAALYAGVAGFLFAHFQRFISPTPFNLGASIDYLFMVIIGGAGSLWGAPLGAALVVVLRDQFNDWIPRITGRAGDFEALVFSLVVIVLLQRAPAGLLPLLARLKRRRAPSDRRSWNPTNPPKRRPIAGGHGHARRGTACAGGDLAQLRRARGEPRRQLRRARERDRRADRPERRRQDDAVQCDQWRAAAQFGHASACSARRPEHLPPRRVAALGVARTFQHVKLLPARSVLENIALGTHLSGRAGLLRAMLRLDRAEEARLLAEARAQAVRVGLGDVLDMPAGDLPLGQQRVVEIARALCLRPRLLLLDEPAAGLRLPEKQRLAALLRQLRAEGMGVLLVEHDMDFVMQLADRVVVMDFGQKIAEGPPDRCSPIRRCMEAYLGGVDMTERRCCNWTGCAPATAMWRCCTGSACRCREGQIVAIVGPNGAGKTTLMGAVMGLLPRRGGTVRYLGAPAGATEALVAAGAVLVPEQRALFTDMSVEDNLLLGFYPRRRAGERDARPSMREVFAIFPRLEERRRQLAATLSGGERQMLALGRALMGRPRLLLLDEPSLGLAPMLVREIFRVLVDLRRARSVDPAGGAKRARGAAGFRLRLCAGDGRGGGRRAERRAGARPARAGNLSRAAASPCQRMTPA